MSFIKRIHIRRLPFTNTMNIMKPKPKEIRMFFEKKTRPLPGGEDDSECPICYKSPIMIPTITNCCHCFCFHCIQFHLNKTCSCPLCHTDIQELYVLGE
jgi:hypothetical protein